MIKSFFKAVAKLVMGVVKATNTALVWVLKRYGDMFLKIARTNGTVTELGVFKAILALLVGTYLFAYVLVAQVIPGSINLVRDSVTIEVLSYETEPMYFSKPEWVTAEGNDGQLSTFGCDERPCTEANSREYRFRDSLYLDIMYVLTKFELYDHADIAGIMQSELNYCKVTKGYGTRNKVFDWYPYIFNVECYDLPDKK